MKINELLIKKLQTVNRWSVRILAILMVLVIVMGVVHVDWTLYQKMIIPPCCIPTISDIPATFCIFVATALMAIARKLIIRDLKQIKPEYLWGAPRWCLRSALATCQRSGCHASIFNSTPIRFRVSET